MHCGQLTLEDAMDLSQDRQQKFSFHRIQQGCNRTESPVIHTVKKKGRILINNNFDVFFLSSLLKLSNFAFTNWMQLGLYLP